MGLIYQGIRGSWRVLRRQGERGGEFYTGGRKEEGQKAKDLGKGIGNPRKNGRKRVTEREH